LQIKKTKILNDRPKKLSFLNKTMQENRVVDCQTKVAKTSTTARALWEGIGERTDLEFNGCEEFLKLRQ